MEEHMLTTIDNPFDPFTQFREWYAFDVGNGYNSLAFLARLVNMSDDLPYASQSYEIEQAIDWIVRENVSGVHTKVKKKTEEIK